MQSRKASPLRTPRNCRRRTIAGLKPLRSRTRSTMEPSNPGRTTGTLPISLSVGLEGIDVVTDLLDVKPTVGKFPLRVMPDRFSVSWQPVAAKIAELR